MIALLRDVVTNEGRAIHRTRLTCDGHKVERLMLGPAKGTAIKLDADSLVTTGLTVAEGLETALSGRAMGLRPAWALGSAGGIEHLPLLDGIERLNLMGEHDERATNEKAVLKCAERWRRADREVHVFGPRLATISMMSGGLATPSTRNLGSRLLRGFGPVPRHSPKTKPNSANN